MIELCVVIASTIQAVCRTERSGNGLERSRDRTELGFERYVMLGILGRNLHVLGKLVIAREANSCEAALSITPNICGLVTDTIAAEAEPVGSWMAWLPPAGAVLTCSDDFGEFIG